MSKCEHNKILYYCRDCKGPGICEHDKRKCYCLECNGASVCEHGKRKEYCRDCKGSGICIHGKTKHYCKECESTLYCNHGKEKRYCKECDGSAYCEHGKVKYICKECKGVGICIHEKEKRYCKECSGSGLCEHNLRKNYCKQCNGSAYCIHNRQKYQCRDCNGKNICIHSKKKNMCIECGGTSLCKHNRDKYNCRECGYKYTCEHGNNKHRCKECGIIVGICKHEKKKSRCKECGGTELCKSSWCLTMGNKKYLGYCLHCFIHIHPDLPVTRNYKTKEKATTDAIIEAFPDLTWIKDKKVEDGCSRRRPDLYADLGSHILIVEIDENQHMEYDCSCENKRLMEISKDFAHRPVVFIRFNPDDYIDTSGNKISSCWRIGNDSIIRIQKNKQTEWDIRLNTLREQIKYWIDNTTSKTLEVVQLFFDQNTKARGGAG
jgi:hypothetical protein